jgi:cytochrome P450
MNRLEDRIRALTNELIDRVIDDGGCEFARDIGRPLPVGIFLDIMGLPRDMMDTFVGWAMDLLHAQDRAAAGRCMAEVTDYLETVIHERAARPDDGMVSAIVHDRPGCEPMTRDEIFGFVFFLFIAGLDTVFATLNNIFLWLAENSDRRRELAADPGNLNNAVEGLLRVFSVPFSGRTLKQDIELRGVAMRRASA